MKDKNKTKAQLIEELTRARERISALEKSSGGTQNQVIDDLRKEIHERQKAEARVQAERQRFNEVLDTLPAYVVLLTPDYRVPFANRFFRERFGESRGRRCYEYLFNRTEPCETCETYTVMKTKAPHHWEWLGPDGRNYDIHDFPFTDIDGTNFILEMGIDITERKQAEEKLRQSEASLAEAQRIAHLGNWDWNIVTNGLQWSDEIYRIFGLSPQEFGATYDAFLNTVHPEDRALVTGSVDAALYQNLPYSIEHRIVLPTGEVRMVHERGEVTFDGAGKPIRMIGTVQDVTERQRAGEALRRASEYHRILIEASLDPLVTIGPDGRITDVNQATEQATGYTRSELIGTDFSDYFIEPERAREGYRKVFKEGLVRDYELSIRSREGRITPVLYNAAVYRDDAGQVQGVFAAARDITVRKRAEAAKERAEQELEAQRTLAIHADRLRSLGEMAAGIAHELNQPLMGIRNMAEHMDIGLQKGWDMPPEKIREKITGIIEQVDRMTHVIEHARIFARGGASDAEMQMVSVNDVIDDAISLIGAQLKSRGIDLIIEKDPTLPKVTINPFSFEEVLLNLINNARDATMERMEKGDGPASPSVTIRTFAGRGDTGGSICLQVIDQGIGIRDEIMDKIFEPFFSTKDTRKGTGLGLSICKSIIERFRGKIEISSAPGAGTTVSVIIPVSSAGRESDHVGQ